MIALVATLLSGCDPLVVPLFRSAQDGAVPADAADASAPLCPDVLEVGSFPMGASPSTVRVAWTGTHHVAVLRADDLRVQLLDRLGAPMGAAVSIAGTAGASPPELLRVADRLVVVYADPAGVALIELSLDGEVVRSRQQVADPAAILDLATYFEVAALAHPDGGLSIVWPDSRHGDTELYFQQVSPTGALVGPNVRLTSAPGDSFQMRLAATDEGSALVWSDERDGPRQTWFGLIARDGSAMATEVALTASPESASDPRLLSTDEGFLVVYARAPDLYSTRLDRRGAPLGSPVALTSILDGYAFDAQLIAHRAEFAMVFQVRSASSLQILFRRLSSAGAPLGEALALSEAEATSYDASLVDVMGQLQVFWSQDGTGGRIARLPCM